MLSLLELEKVSKSFANHYRIRILELLNNRPKLSLEEIASDINANYKTISMHTRKLHRGGLIEKKYLARTVIHVITTRGRAVLTFLRKLE